MITSATIGGYSLTSSQIFLQGIQNGSFPETVYTRSKRGGYQGNKMPTPTFASYQFVLQFEIVGLTFADLNAQRDAFFQLLGYIHSQGVQTLVLTRSDGAQRQIDIKAVQVTGNYTTDDLLSCIVEVTLLAEYPFLQSSILKSQDILLTNGGGMGVPMGVPLNLSNGASTTLTITNNGNYAAYPTLTFIGLLTNPSLTITNNGVSQTFNIPANTLSTSSDKYVVDCYNRTVVILPSGNVGRQNITGTFITIPIGTSTIQLTSSSGGDTGKCTVQFRDTFLNI